MSWILPTEAKILQRTKFERKCRPLHRYVARPRLEFRLKQIAHARGSANPDFAKLGRTFTPGNAMFNPKFFDEINARVSQIIADSPAKDIEKNVRALMNAAFAKMELVTREEFDVQVELLARTRAKLDALERQLAELEQRTQGNA